jgi:hypothetical protein
MSFLQMRLDGFRVLDQPLPEGPLSGSRILLAEIGGRESQAGPRLIPEIGLTGLESLGRGVHRFGRTGQGGQQDQRLGQSVNDQNDAFRLTVT